MERATLVFQLDVPHALGAIEQAGGEISTLGHTFNFLSGGNRKKSKKSKLKAGRNRNDSVPRPGQDSKMELFGRHGMQRVVQDISSITLVSPSPGKHMLCSFDQTAHTLPLRSRCMRKLAAALPGCCSSARQQEYAS